MPNTLIAYFGYGSLVNRATHRTDIAGYSPARLKGWRRQWLPRPHSDFGPVAMLSVFEDSRCEIDGLVVRDFARNLPAVDAREIRYNRQHLQSHQLDILQQNDKAEAAVNIYVAKHVDVIENAHQCRILRSYLDAVMQGYFNKFGHEGLLRFVQTSENFAIGIREDRKKPVYQRPVVTTAKERALFDNLVPS